ncbi:MULTISPECIES: HIT family protein [Pseudomonas]|uniref:HIT domain-containing protein n=2 Tax=Pseudomonas TaxID=286 RepID=A0A0D0TME0_PSEFL|nr:MULTISPECIES: hypothetical protein [Pseudomonas fluorescens group]AZE62273.1 hypothetical protein C4K02_3927 [Pseudomonas synxantha]KIR23069.1 hypothetical protein PFLU3_14810 [Pseudomonas fluorescens]
MSALTVYSGKHIVISHCRDCDIPGYMIISLQRVVSELGELGGDERAELMLGLTYAERALHSVFAPEKIYIMRISELDPVLHFHVFPRYAQATQLYLEEHAEPVIDGAFFFSWARKRFSSVLPQPTPDIGQAQSILQKTLGTYFLQ